MIHPVICSNSRTTKRGKSPTEVTKHSGAGKPTDLKPAAAISSGDSPGYLLKFYDKKSVESLPPEVRNPAIPSILASASLQNAQDFLHNKSEMCLSTTICLLHVPKNQQDSAASSSKPRLGKSLAHCMYPSTDNTQLPANPSCTMKYHYLSVHLPDNRQQSAPSSYTPHN